MSQISLEKSGQKNDASEKKGEKDVENIKTYFTQKYKNEEITKKHETIRNDILKDAHSKKMAFDDSQYDYYDSYSHIYHYKYIDELLDLTFIILSCKNHGYNKTKIELKLDAIKILLDSLPRDKKHEKLNEYSNRIKYIYEDLVEYFVSPSINPSAESSVKPSVKPSDKKPSEGYLVSLKKGLVENKDEAIENAGRFLFLHKKDCLKIGDSRITEVITDLENNFKKYQQKSMREAKESQKNK